MLHYRICHCFDQVSLQLAATAEIVHKATVEDDPQRRRRRPDISLAKKVLDWQPKVAFETGPGQRIVFRKGTKAGDIIQMAVEFIPMNIEYRVVLGALNLS